MSSAKPVDNQVQTGGQQRAVPARARSFDPTELLSRLWLQNLPIMRDRVANLEAAAQESRLGELVPARRTEASDIAHKLAGSLGMFGYPAGTEIARELESLLEAPTPIDPSRFLQLAAQLRSVLPL